MERPLHYFQIRKQIVTRANLAPNQFTEAEPGNNCYCFKDTSIEKETLGGTILEEAYYVHNHTSKGAVFGLAQRLIQNGQEKSDILPLYAEILLPEGQTFFIPTAKIGLCIVGGVKSSQYIAFESSTITWFCLEENKALTIQYNDQYRFKTT